MIEGLIDFFVECRILEKFRQRLLAFCLEAAACIEDLPEHLSLRLGEKINDLVQQSRRGQLNGVACHGAAEFLIGNSLGVRLGLANRKKHIDQKNGISRKTFQQSDARCSNSPTCGVLPLSMVMIFTRSTPQRARTRLIVPTVTESVQVRPVLSVKVFMSASASLGPLGRTFRGGRFGGDAHRKRFLQWLFNRKSGDGEVRVKTGSVAVRDKQRHRRVVEVESSSSVS